MFNELILNVYKNMWDDGWYNRIIDSVSFSFAIIERIGYIYYYGRCWDGQPQYDEAFRYFSVGAAGGIYESRYKLADMFAKGYGVVQNKNIISL